MFMGKKLLITVSIVSFLSMGCAQMTEQTTTIDPTTRVEKPREFKRKGSMGILSGLLVSAMTGGYTTPHYVVGAFTGGFLGGLIGVKNESDEKRLIGILKSSGVSIEESWKMVKINLESDINFDFDKSELRPDADEIIGAIALALKDYGLKKFDIEVNGYADYKGSDEYNNILALKRAEAVKDRLKEEGIPLINFLPSVSHGEYDLKLGCVKLSCFRRVEILLIKK
jgi:outer membrane protein OmpA-like peptidoglycan-associated protein